MPPSTPKTTTSHTITTSRIHILDKNTINQIAAGEVIERPASVVKELVENAIDAGSDRIIVRVEEGGIKKIEVEDNGCGMYREDAVLAFEKHATSKIAAIEDLHDVMTLGFRGEALPSIASVAKVELTTRRKESLEESGVLIMVEGGEMKEVKSISRAPGTKVVVKELFYNTPARKNYLKTPRTELNHIMDVMTRYALFHGDIGMQLFSDENRVMNSPKSASLLANIGAIYGKNTAKEFIEVDYAKDFFSIKGYISKPSVDRASRAHQYLYVNERYVKSEVVYKGIRTAYGNLLPKGRYPLAVLLLRITPGKVDVNVHPTKEEVRFSEDFVIMEGVINAIRYQLHKHELIGDGTKLGEPLETMACEEKGSTGQKPGLSPEEREGAGAGAGGGAAGPSEFVTGNELLERSAKDFEKDLEKLCRQGERIGVPKVKEEKAAYSPQGEGAGKGQAASPTRRAQRQLRIDSSRAQEEKSLLERAKHLQVKPKYVEDSALPPMTAVGQIFDLYILAVGVDSLYIIDQHAIHEKIVYERLRKEQVERSAGSKQRLIDPVSFECNPREEKIIQEQLPTLAKLGFEVAYFGKNTFLVKAVPSILGRTVQKETIFDIVEELLDIYKQKKVIDALDTTIKTIACHSAIRKGKTLSQSEMDSLIQEVHSSENPYSCPHGRPTIISISIEELEKRFKRR